ncbi:hypothetical protein [Schaalia hyovaginalis]|uniref:hypothetical protein n=1 Tax=Schaalia hyovaginalis TaxID=29316 RepID=UPI0026F36C0C|nr:hypothetical protein [Schaalia hyovaginalis]MCI6557111.1 hypothetical protein [Schaalia hyovaginalis]MDY3665473.1 hypothetical protein [Schaalia hyovaginalis]MDY4491897.1 hypothetical protein [Schaalia hyovaginalis]
MRIRIDQGRTLLPICDCGWRGDPTLDRGNALQQGRDHELRAHTGDKDALRSLNAYRWRHAAP